MNKSKRIKGIDLLLQKLPEEYHYWHCFGTILMLNYEKTFDYEKKFENIDCINLILTDKECKYKIKVKLNDVIGDISFNVTNGFFSGLTIEDHYDDYAEYGYETDRCFLITSFEQDIEFELWCDSISVELLN